MGSMTGMTAMTGTGIPDAARVLWTVLLCAVIALHGGHAVAQRGAYRWWHAGHILMAAGMVAMFLPVPMTSTTNDVGVLVYSCAAAGAVGYTGLSRDRTGIVDSVWLLSTVDMLVMVYMFLAPGSTPALLDNVLIGYLGLATVLWLTGVLPRWTGRRTAVAQASGGTATAVRADLVLHCTPAVRTTLAVMTASMAYMLAAM